MKIKRMLLCLSLFLALSAPANDMISLAGTDFITATGKNVTSAPSGKITAFYFSAHWCPPCKVFTPKLVEFYRAVKRKHPDFEIVFVSADHSKEEMLQYLREADMPWLAVPYKSPANQSLRSYKQTELKNPGIPALVVVLNNGTVVTQNGRPDVEKLGVKAYDAWASVPEPAPDSPAQTVRTPEQSSAPAPSDGETDTAQDENTANRSTADETRIPAQHTSGSVLILCKTQLLEPPVGFDRFCAAHDQDQRSALRKQMIEALKSIAGAGEQQTVLQAMKHPEDATRLWIINAVAATLSPEEIQKIEKLPEVQCVYRTQRKPRPPPSVSQRLSEVIRPAEQPPFTTGKRIVPWNLKKIGADNVWSELNVTGTGVIVALLDSGANYAHTDLRNNLWINSGEIPNNGQDDDRNGLIDDYCGYDFTARSCEVRVRGPKQHGTWTGGIIAGDGSGGILTGIAPRARLMLLKANGTADVAQAFQYALENGADVMNMSFSIPGLGQERGVWRLMAEQTVAAGLVLVSGCGNFQLTEKIPLQIRIPEGIPCVIGAGGLDENLQVPRFCSLGPVEWKSVDLYGDYPLPDGLIKPDVCGFTGPRYPVLATEDKGYIDPNNRIQGNSFSSPHVAGVAALMLSAAPELPAWKVKTLLEQTAEDLEAPGKDNRTGAGLARAFEAVRAAQEEIAPDNR